MDFVKDVESGKAQLLDVRTKLEWKLGHAKGATHIPLDQLSVGYIDSLEQDRPVYVYCASGARSSRAQIILSNLGFNAQNIGGLKNWIQAGGVTEK